MVIKTQINIDFSFTLIHGYPNFNQDFPVEKFLVDCTWLHTDNLLIQGSTFRPTYVTRLYWATTWRCSLYNHEKLDYQAIVDLFFFNKKGVHR